jgi:RimJ/RimL family protein N-acetyltransferase
MKLSPLTEADKPLINKWLQDPAIQYYLITEKINPALDILSYGIWSNNELIGWINLQNIDYENSKAEYGMALPGKKPIRVAFRATIEILKIAFYELGLNRVYARPLQSNLRKDGMDQRERFGFIREGIERQSVKRVDVYEDVVIFSILKEEFERRWGNASNPLYYGGGGSV